MSNDRLKFRAWMYSPARGYYMEHSGDNLPGFFKECDGEPIMQWTGIYDSEGVEIYVGDFVSAPDVYPGYYGDDPGADGVLKISWDGTTARYAGVDGNGEPHELTDWIYDDLTSTFVVAGNIYESPNLMERANG